MPVMTTAPAAGQDNLLTRDEQLGGSFPDRDGGPARHDHKPGLPLRLPQSRPEHGASGRSKCSPFCRETLKRILARSRRCQAGGAVS